MGDPRKQRKKYSTPSHPWEKLRIDNENNLMKLYGMKNKKEIWKMASLLRHFKSEVKRLSGKKDAQSKLETKQLLARISKLGIASKDIDLNQILDLPVEAVLDRRLQTIVFKNGIAKTISQARQLIAHGHVAISSKKVTVPSYLVRVGEENKISFSAASKFQRPDHPEKFVKKELTVKKAAKPKEQAKQAMDEASNDNKVSEAKQIIQNAASPAA